MCLSREALLAVPYGATSLTEDVEYGLDLAEAGIAVEYEAEARVFSEVPATAADSEGERRRWEAGRRALVARAPRLIGLGLRRREPMLLALAADLLIPPLDARGRRRARAPARARAPRRAGGARLRALALPARAARAARLAPLGTGARGLAALAHLPIYLLWKAKLALGRWQRPGWTRPTRAGRLASAAQTPPCTRR